MLQFDDIIRSEKQQAIANIWEDGEFFNVGCFIGLTAYEDDEDEIDIGGIDFNVIGYSTHNKKKISAIGLVDDDCANSINRAFNFTSQMLKKVNCGTDDNLKKAIDEFKKEKIVVDFVGASGASGPSSGLGFGMAMLSKATGQHIMNGHRTAFTGEISINGDVTEVGGIYAKLKAAEASGIQKVFLPKANQADLKLFTSNKLRLIYVRNAGEIIQACFPNLRFL